MSVLVCENLSKRINKNEYIRNFNYNFLDNQIYAIVGKSDSYKEEILDLITGKINADDGKVYLDGQALFNNNFISERLCYISRNTTFPGNIKIKSIFKLMATLYPKWDNAYAFELIENFQINPRSTYSSLKSNKRTLLLGILGLASRANITVFDNPVGHADVKDRYEYFKFLYSHHERYPRTMIMTTDYIDELDYIVNNILFIDKGRLFETYKTEDIKDDFRYLSGKTEVLKSLINGIKVIGVEERGKTLTICIRQKLKKDDIRKFQKYLIEIFDVPIQKVFIYLINLREVKGI